MSKIVNYNNMPIILYYSSKSILEEELKKSVSIESKGSGQSKDYEQAHQEAQLYMIRDALIKKPRLRLKKIVGIKQDVDCIDPKEGIVKIVLEGIAVFK